MTLARDAAAAWTRWDAQPSERSRVVALNRCVAAYGASIGVPAIVVDRLVQEARRDGCDPLEAFRRVDAAVGRSD